MKRLRARAEQRVLDARHGIRAAYSEWVGKAYIGSLAGLATLAKHTPMAKRALAELSIELDVPYGDHPAQRVDVYRPSRPRPDGASVLYFHGGGFRFLSKDSHWIFGLRFAQAGYTVYNVEYRLAPEHPYPAAVEDACLATETILLGDRFDASPEAFVLAGESAGANLALTLGMCCVLPRSETFTRPILQAKLQPRALALGCGILQVSDPERLSRGHRLPSWEFDRLTEVADGYLRPRDGQAAQNVDLADPLVLLEAMAELPGPLAPTFVFCGTGDPLIEDTRRLALALETLGQHVELREYEGAGHAFHAVPGPKSSEAAWRDQLAFLERSAER